MMQWWTPDAVRFMRDASEYGAHYTLLSEYLMRWLPAGGHVCDAGCGLGYLAQALAAHCRCVTAIDRSEAAIAAALARDLPGNLRFYCDDVFAMHPDPLYDAMTFCYFGRTEEILCAAKRQCSGVAVMVKRDCSERRFSVSQTRTHRDVRASAEELLRSLKIPFEISHLALELGQPFRSMGDAVRFFSLYNEGKEISESWVASRLQETGRADFPLYLPETRNMAIIALEAKAIPEEFA